MSDRQLVNEGGTLVAKDPNTGDEVPLEVKELEALSATSDKGVMEQRLEAVYEANSIRAEAGMPASETAGVEAGVTPGLSDSGALSSDTSFTILSESDASSEADSGSGTESDPYVIRDRDLSNDESSGIGINIDDDGASYYIDVVNCRVRGYTSEQLRTSSGSRVRFRDCKVWDASTDLCRQDGSGDVIFERCLFAGSGSRVVDQRSGSITFRNCRFDQSQSSGRYQAVQTNSRNAGSVTIEHCRFVGVGAVNMRFDRDRTVIENCLFEQAGIMGRFPDERLSNLTIRYCRVDDAPGNSLTVSAYSNVEVAHCYFNDNAAGSRVVRFQNAGGGGDVRDARVHHCKFTKTTGSGAGDECLEVFPGGADIEFDYNWVTECTEDAYEAAYARSNIHIHHCVADNCSGQIVDFFNGWGDDGVDPSDGGGPISSRTDHIYGDTASQAVLITDCDDVTVHDIYARCNRGVVLEQNNGSAGSTPSNCTINGPLPLSEVTSVAIFDTIGSIGSDNQVLYLDDETLQTPLDSPEQTEIR